jgi:hypothetical protein
MVFDDDSVIKDSRDPVFSASTKSYFRPDFSPSFIEQGQPQVNVRRLPSTLTRD